MIKMKDALKELKEKFDENEFYNLDKEFDNEYVQRFAEDFPESFKAIQRLDTTKKYINLDDYQGDSFACGRIGSLKGWAYQVCEWATMDDYCDVTDPDDWMHIGLLPLMNNFESKYLNFVYQRNMANKYSRSGGINTMKNKNSEVMNLETILVSLGCKKPFKKNGDISKDGWKAYDKLMSILIFLKDNNVINFRQDNLDRWVDEVVENKNLK